MRMLGWPRHGGIDSAATTASRYRPPATMREHHGRLLGSCERGDALLRDDFRARRCAFRPCAAHTTSHDYRPSSLAGAQGNRRRPARPRPSGSKRLRCNAAMTLDMTITGRMAFWLGRLARRRFLMSAGKFPRATASEVGGSSLAIRRCRLSAIILFVPLNDAFLRAPSWHFCTTGGTYCRIRAAISWPHTPHARIIIARLTCSI